MENARIVVAEDNDKERRLLQHIAESSGHQVVREAVSLPEAMQAVQDVSQGDLEADVFIIAGLIDRAPRSETAKQPAVDAHAREIIEKIRELDLPVKIIGFAPLPMRRLEAELDADPSKTNPRIIPGIIEKF